MKKHYPLVLLILLSLFPLIPLFHSGMFAAHDSQSHVARLVAFYNSLSEGNIVPRWAENLNMGYGHPILMFLYPLTGYLGSFFHFFGFSFIDSIKIVFGLSYVASGLSMYFLILEIGKNNKLALFSSLLYLYSPYHFVDFYVRGALGEHVAFVFLPLVCLGLLKIAKSLNYQAILLTSLGIAGLLLSHNAVSVMFSPFVIIFALLLIWKNKRNISIIIAMVSSIVLGFLLSAFFWLPAFFEGKYTLRDILTRGVYIENFVSPNRLFSLSWSYGGSQTMPVQIDPLSWLVLLSCVIFLILKKIKKEPGIFLLSLFFCLGSIFLLLPSSIFIYEKLTVLQKFQFPWRFLSVIIFYLSFLSYFVLSVFKKTLQNIIIISGLIISLLISYKSFKPSGYLSLNDSYFINSYQGTTDTGESSPIWSIRGMENRPKAPLEVIDGVSKITQISRNSTKHVYEVQNDKETLFMENTVYFPGWLVQIDGKEIKPEFQNPKYQGIMTFKVPSGNHHIDVTFTNTKVRTLGNITSFFSSLLLILVLPLFSKKRIL